MVTARRGCWCFRKDQSQGVEARQAEAHPLWEESIINRYWKIYYKIPPGSSQSGGGWSTHRTDHCYDCTHAWRTIDYGTAKQIFPGSTDVGRYAKTRGVERYIRRYIGQRWSARNLPVMCNAQGNLVRWRRGQAGVKPQSPESPGTWWRGGQEQHR